MESLPTYRGDCGAANPFLGTGIATAYPEAVHTGSAGIRRDQKIQSRHLARLPEQKWPRRRANA